MKVEVLADVMPYRLNYYRKGSVIPDMDREAAKILQKLGMVRAIGSEKPKRKRRVYRRKDIVAEAMPVVEEQAVVVPVDQDTDISVTRYSENDMENTGVMSGDENPECD